MKKEDLFSLPENVIFNLTDRICNYKYSLEKNIMDNGNYMYCVICKNTRQERLYFFDNYIENESDKTIIRSLTVMSGCGGLAIHSEYYENCLNELQFETLKTKENGNN